jgi:tripartite-type tricarboxylate transporter receptor subunit TctC
MNGRHQIWERATGVKLMHVPYGNNGPLQDVVAGNVNLMWSSLQVVPLITSGKLTPLAYSGSGRNVTLPAVPTVSEMGYPRFESRVWFGVVGPAGIPSAIVKKVQVDVDTIVKTAGFRDRMTELGNDTYFLSSEEFMDRIRKDYASNKLVFDELKIDKQ